MEAHCQCSGPPPAYPSGVRGAAHTRGHIRSEAALCDMWCQLPLSARICRPDHPWLDDNRGLSPSFGCQ